MNAPFSCTLTFLPDIHALSKREVDLAPVDLAEQIRTTNARQKSGLSPMLFPGCLGDKPNGNGCLRYDGNVSWITAAAADYDGEQISFDAALAILREVGLYCILYTSPSHTPDKPRWRVLAFASRRLPPSEHVRLVARLNGRFEGTLDPGSFSLSRSYYLGYVGDGLYHRVEVVPGDYIDLRDDLDAGAIGKSNGAGAQPGAATGPLDEATQIEAILTGTNYHGSIIRLAGKWALRGLPLLAAQQRLEEIMDRVFPPDRDRRWHERRADIPNILLYVYGKQSDKRDAADYVEWTLNGNRISDRAPP